MMIDLHNHTLFSYDGSDTPETVIENAVVHGVSAVGITDHQFSVMERQAEYVAYISRCRARYEDRIRVLCGLEIGTRPTPGDFIASSSKELDYCLFESLDSMRGEDIFEFFEWRRLFSCKVGLAHTDIFALSERYGIDMLREMERRDIFWELNTSGNYAYYYDFLTNPKKRRMVQMSGITVSVGSDTHWVREYRFNQIKRANELIAELGNPVVFAD